MSEQLMEVENSLKNTNDKLNNSNKEVSKETELI